MDMFFGVIVGLLVLMVLVIAHEFGHFLAARRNGVNVLEFGIGFPPRAIAWRKDPKTGKWKRLPRTEWKKEKVSKVVYSDAGDNTLAQKGMIFSLNWLPIGGFCQMDGESAADTRAGTFGKASFWAKTKILFAGVAMNWLVAIIIFTVLAWTGMPEFVDGQFSIPSDTRTESIPVQITSVAEDSPAARAGMKAGDYIVEVGTRPPFDLMGQSVSPESFSYISINEITDYNKGHAGDKAIYQILRTRDTMPNCSPLDCFSGYTEQVEVVLNPSGSEYLLGVTMTSSQKTSYSTWSAPLVGVGLTAQLTGETFKGLGIMVWNLISGVGSQFSPDSAVRESGQQAISSVGDSVSGPVGIIGVLFPAFTAAGPTNLAFLAALISVSLACMNVLPIPALDGGRWLLIAIYKLRKKQLTKETEEKIVSRAFMALLAIILVVTILDIIRMVG